MGAGHSDNWLSSLISNYSQSLSSLATYLSLAPSGSLSNSSFSSLRCATVSGTGRTNLLRVGLRSRVRPEVSCSSREQRSEMTSLTLAAISLSRRSTLSTSKGGLSYSSSTFEKLVK
jgi:hypothetical protein